MAATMNDNTLLATVVASTLNDNTVVAEVRVDAGFCS